MSGRKRGYSSTRASGSLIVALTSKMKRTSTMHKITAKEALSAVLVGLVSLSTACTTMRPIAADGVGESIRREIKGGDTVRIVTRDGGTHTLQVAVVGMTSLGGNVVNTWKGDASAVGTRFDVRYADITELDVRRLSGLKNVGLGAAAVLVWIAAATNGGRHSPGYNR